VSDLFLGQSILAFNVNTANIPTLNMNFLSVAVVNVIVAICDVPGRRATISLLVSAHHHLTFVQTNGWSNAAMAISRIHTQDIGCDTSAPAWALVAAGLIGASPVTTPGVGAEDGPHSKPVDAGALANVVVLSPITKTVEPPLNPMEMGMSPTATACSGARVWPARMYCVVPWMTVVVMLTACRPPDACAPGVPRVGGGSVAV